jgi:4'-phosphopantetheinyl transferase
MTLFPVVMAIPRATPGLSGEERVARLSALSREALRMSADRSGIALGDPLKDLDDVPLPRDGSYWSVSHKPRCVAAVVSREPAGIDVEDTVPRSALPFRLVAGEEEWELGGGRSRNVFFRYWTAKEAVLKSVGVGISGLKKCRVVSVPDEDHILLDYRDRIFRIGQFYYCDHVVAVLQDENDVEWSVAEHSSFRLSDKRV